MYNILRTITRTTGFAIMQPATNVFRGSSSRRILKLYRKIGGKFASIGKLRVSLDTVKRAVCELRYLLGVQTANLSGRQQRTLGHSDFRVASRLESLVSKYKPAAARDTYCLVYAVTRPSHHWTFLCSAKTNITPDATFTRLPRLFLRHSFHLRPGYRLRWIALLF